MPVALLALALCAFAIGTTEFVIMGLLLCLFTFSRARPGKVKAA